MDAATKALCEAARDVVAQHGHLPGMTALRDAVRAVEAAPAVEVKWSGTARDQAASVHGWSLRAWRFSPGRRAFAWWAGPPVGEPIKGTAPTLALAKAAAEKAAGVRE